MLFELGVRTRGGDAARYLTNFRLRYTTGEVKKDSRSDSEGESTVDEQLTLESEDCETEDDAATSKSIVTEVNSNIVKPNGNGYLHSGKGDCDGLEDKVVPED